MKKIYTDKDIEELHHSGVKSLRVVDDVVLTDLAYEKAGRLGIELVTEGADVPPAAPVRPYLSEVKPPQPKPVIASVQPADSPPLSSTLTLQPLREAPPWGSRGERGVELEKRIRDAVAARLGDQVDATLLDTIIKRTLKVIRLK